MELSIVIPVRNEAANIAPLVREIGAALDGRIDYEIVYVDDGSSDGTDAAVRALPPVRLIRHRRTCGQSAAIRTGVKAARGHWIATLDGDGQNDPADIPRLFEIARTAPRDPPVLVAGLRAKRRDSAAKRWASRIANGVRSRLLGDATQDTGCGLKIVRREVFLELPFFDHNHRFLPALMMRHGGRTISVPVNHRPRQRGQSNYGVFDRLWVSLFDLFGVMWLQHRGSLPEIVAEPEAVDAPRAAKSASPVP